MNRAFNWGSVSIHSHRHLTSGRVLTSTRFSSFTPLSKQGRHFPDHVLSVSRRAICGYVLCLLLFFRGYPFWMASKGNQKDTAMPCWRCERLWHLLQCLRLMQLHFAEKLNPYFSKSSILAALSARYFLLSDALPSDPPLKV